MKDISNHVQKRLGRVKIVCRKDGVGGFYYTLNDFPNLVELRLDYRDVGSKILTFRSTAFSSQARYQVQPSRAKEKHT